MRWTLLIQVQTVPKFNAQFNPYSLPCGTDGWLAILGTFGLWIALLIIIRETLNGLTRDYNMANLTRRQWLKSVSPSVGWSLWSELP